MHTDVRTTPPKKLGSRRITDKLLSQLRVPVVGSPMFIVSTPELVIAQCKAGIVGSIPALNARPKELLRDWISQIKEELASYDANHPDAPSAPFAVNQIAHRTNERLAHDMRVIADAKVPIVIISLAAPAEMLDAVHSYGGLVFNDVVNARHGLKCAEAGVDGLIAVCSGAGGHTGTISPFALVPEIRQFWEGPLGLGGAISSGRGVRAAQMLGADFAYMGTAFIPAHEANAQEGYKDMVITSTSEEIIMSDKLTGVKANFMRRSLELQGYDLAAMAVGGPGTKGFGEEGSSAKAWRDIWSAGHGVGCIKARRPAAEIIAEIQDEYKALGS
jgi:nitronate monooxygenase